MKDIAGLKYRKPHLLVLKNFKAAQVLHGSQKKTFDRCFLRNCYPVSMRFNEYEALRRMVSRKLYKLVRISLRTPPYILVTAKPREIRMGKGKGAFSHFQAPVKVGSTFVRVNWNWNLALSRVFIGLRSGVRKASQHLHF
jgi:ribosomal protein L16/L10AE